MPCWGNPTSAKAQAKPKACNRPKLKATSHGGRVVKLGFPRRAFRISTETSMMLSAMVASTGGPGTFPQRHPCKHTNNLASEIYREAYHCDSHNEAAEYAAKLEAGPLP